MPTPPATTRRRFLYGAAAGAALLSLPGRVARAQSGDFREFSLPRGAHPHDVAPAPDGTVWYTGQHVGNLGRLDPDSGDIHTVPLGRGSRPHGVIVGPDGAAWVTDGGLNAIVRVDGQSEAVQRFPLNTGDYANLNTATFDDRGMLWFTGQAGIYGRVNPDAATVEVWDSPRGYGPYGIDKAPDGTVYYASLRASFLGRIEPPSPDVTVLEPPTSGQGCRRVWCDSRSRAWVSEWNAGQLGLYDPDGQGWREWPLPGSNPKPYAIYVDERDIVWLSDFGANAVVRYDPQADRFTRLPIPSANSQVRQMLGRPGELWGAESGTDKLFVLYTG